MSSEGDLVRERFALGVTSRRVIGCCFVLFSSNDRFERERERFCFALLSPGDLSAGGCVLYYFRRLMSERGCFVLLSPGDMSVKGCTLHYSRRVIWSGRGCALRQVICPREFFFHYFHRVICCGRLYSALFSPGRVSARGCALHYLLRVICQRGVTLCITIRPQVACGLHHFRRAICPREAVHCITRAG